MLKVSKTKKENSTFVTSSIICHSSEKEAGEVKTTCRNIKLATVNSERHKTLCEPIKYLKNLRMKNLRMKVCNVPLDLDKINYLSPISFST